MNPRIGGVRGGGPFAKSLAPHATCPVFLAMPLCSSLAPDLTDMACRNRQGLFLLVPLQARIMFKYTLEPGPIPGSRLVTMISLFYGLQTVLFCSLHFRSY